MRDQTERQRADRLADAVDRLLQGESVKGVAGTPEDARLLDTARQLAELPSLLGPVDPALEQQVMRRVRLGSARRAAARRPRPGWAAATALAALLVVALVTPLGQTAVAELLAIFDLGRTEVHITPVSDPMRVRATAEAGTAVVREVLSPETAADRIPFPWVEPTYLPPGYGLLEMAGYTYPELPRWVPQPFSMELIYATSQGHKVSLRLYPITLSALEATVEGPGGASEQARVARLDLQATHIQEVEEVEINGQPGVLLQLGKRGAETAWQEVVWEQGQLMLALSATDLTESDLLRIARSVR